MHEGLNIPEEIICGTELVVVTTGLVWGTGVTNLETGDSVTKFF